MKVKRKRRFSVYQALGEAMDRERRGGAGDGPLRPGELVRQMRLARGLKGVDVCRRAGNLDPRTLTALEKGRIKNPTLKTLQSVAAGLGLPVSELLARSEMELPRYFYRGTQKGFFEVEFRSMGIKAISFTPFVKDFFFGKLIVGPRCRFEETLLRHPHPIFASALVGRFDLELEGEKLALREGENVFFRGNLRHSFYNPLQRESVLFLVTSPSFFK